MTIRNRSLITGRGGGGNKGDIKSLSHTEEGGGGGARKVLSSFDMGHLNLSHTEGGRGWGPDMLTIKTLHIYMQVLSFFPTSCGVWGSKRDESGEGSL